MNYKLLGLVCCIIFFNTVIFAQSIFTDRQLKLLDSISAQDVPNGAPGVATAVIRNGEVIYEKCAGFADLGDSSLITRESRFNLASNGKQFTALAVLTLIEEKRINLKDDVRKFLPTLFPKVKITIENLLNHTSGIRDVYDLWSLQGLTWWKKTFSNKDVLELVEKQQELNFTPNSEYLYSNTNYILLTLIIEKVTGRSFIEFTNELFQKLNMPNTSFENDYTKIKGPVAKAYFNFDKWTTYNWIWNVYGDGNFFSTLSDQIQWEKLVQGKASSSIKKETITKSQSLIYRSAIKNYGYGLEFGKYKGVDYTFHEGATGAWKATVTRFPGKQISIITMTNTGKAIPSMQTRQMADIILKLNEDSKYLVTKPAKTGKYVNEDDIVGTYLTDNNFNFQFEKRDGKLYLKRVGRNDVELEREADNIFRQTFDPAFKQEFTINSKGEMEVTAYYTTHSPYTLTRMNNDWSNFNYQALSGKYLNGETNTFIEINFTDGQNYDVKVGTRNINKGLLVSPVKFLVGNYVINIERRNGRIDTLLLNGERIRKVKFIRVN